MFLQYLESSRSEMTRIRYNFARIRDENLNFVLFARIVLIPSLILHFSVTPAAILTFSTFSKFAKFSNTFLSTLMVEFQSKFKVSVFSTHHRSYRLILGKRH